MNKVVVYITQLEKDFIINSDIVSWTIPRKKSKFILMK